MTPLRRTAAGVAAVLVATSGCSAPDTASRAECVSELLAGYRALAGSAERVVRGHGSIVREVAKLTFAAPVSGIRITIGEVFDPPLDDAPAKLRPLFRRVRRAFRETEAATSRYAAGARRLGRAARSCSEELEAGCASALADLEAALDATAASMDRSARGLRSDLRRQDGIEEIGIALERQGIALQQRQARLQQAADSAAACL